VTQLSAVVLALANVSCVTVNVNFPESAVQQATDEYVRDIYRTRGGKNGKNQPGSEVTPAPTKSEIEFRPLYQLAQSILISEAHAAEGVFKADTDKALEIKTRLSSRVSEVIAQKKAGVLGETNDGLLQLKGADKLKKLQTMKVEQVVSDENADRAALYEEIRKANGVAEGRLKDIQKSFARSFQAESPSGTWLQDADGKWAQKP
jgi:uncharacterized protein YdbL (DUF1318 family)